MPTRWMLNTVNWFAGRKESRVLRINDHDSNTQVGRPFPLLKIAMTAQADELGHCSHFDRPSIIDFGQYTPHCRETRTGKVPRCLDQEIALEYCAKRKVSICLPGPRGTRDRAVASLTGCGSLPPIPQPVLKPSGGQVPALVKHENRSARDPAHPQLPRLRIRSGECARFLKNSPPA